MLCITNVPTVITFSFFSILFFSRSLFFLFLFIFFLLSLSFSFFLFSRFFFFLLFLLSFTLPSFPCSFHSYSSFKKMATILNANLPNFFIQWPNDAILALIQNCHSFQHHFTSIPLNE